MRKLLVTLSMLAVIGAASAQDCERATSGPFETATKGQNWYMSFGGGVNIYMGDKDGHFSLGKRLGATGNIAFGKWLNPYVALEGQFTINKAKGAINPSLPGYSVKSYYYGTQDAAGYYKEKFNYWTAGLNAKANLSAVLCGYNAKRFFEVLPYVGAGYTRHFNSHEDNSEEELFVQGGLTVSFRLSKALNLNIDGRYMIVNQRFDRTLSNNDEFEGALALNLGFTYKFGKTRAFQRPCKQAACDYSDYEKRIKSLEGDLSSNKKKFESEVNDLKNKLDACQDKLNAKPKEIIVEKPTVEEVKSLRESFAAIHFDTGKSTIKKDSYGALNNAAIILKKYPKSLIKLSGYTDNTGSRNTNVSLSQRRADAVKAYLQQQGVVNPIQATGYGPDSPVATNATAAGRALNRRTEISVE